MIENELLFLGLLKDGPKHGYEIKRLIEEDFSRFVGLNIKSIYYPLKKMEQLGLINKEQDRSGNYPEKHVYSLTPKGEEIFEHLITESFLSIKRPYFDIDLSLYFLQYVDRAIARRQLRGRMLFLKKIIRQIEGVRAETDPAKKHLHIILEHNLDLVAAELKSVQKLVGILDGPEQL
ncbi:MAG: PadR family transcriptional regulator [Candidatus Omnitrophica bacterium]|nr:PadR family transcriptional regulator [Candidatus Omnitrophota bacterium]MCB9721383.1 PadR family transcriptional regulator [Candidatus Omnitrophota bacterium]